MRYIYIYHIIKRGRVIIEVGSVWVIQERIVNNWEVQNETRRREKKPYKF